MTNNTNSLSVRSILEKDKTDRRKQLPGLAEEFEDCPQAGAQAPCH